MPSYSAVLFSPSPSYEGEKQNCVDQIYRKNLTLPRLRKVVADQALDNAILKEAASKNY